MEEIMGIILQNNSFWRQADLETYSPHLSGFSQSAGPFRYSQFQRDGFFLGMYIVHMGSLPPLISPALYLALLRGTGSLVDNDFVRATNCEAAERLLMWPETHDTPIPTDVDTPLASLIIQGLGNETVSLSNRHIQTAYSYTNYSPPASKDGRPLTTPSTPTPYIMYCSLAIASGLERRSTSTSKL